MRFSLPILSSLAITGNVAARCVQSLVPLRLSATNYDLDDATLNTTVSVSGTFTIEMNYCPPTNATAALAHADTLLITFPGATYNTLYWDFPFKPETYSFVRYANSGGFAVLNVARIGAGLSDRPEPRDVLQVPLQVSAEIAVADLARKGGIPGAADKKFKKLVGLGHSLSGSILSGVIVSAPKALDGAIFTGFGHVVPPPSDIALIPANQAGVPRLARLPDGYLTTQDAGRASRGWFYGPDGTFDPKVLAYDEATKDTVSVGELSTLGTTLVAAPGFKGHVLAANGRNDAGACVPPSCDNIFQEAEYYPNAQSFEAVVIPDAGHDINLHLIAPVFYKTLLAWIERHRF
ncbi:hypothetical protein AURDEDRAFT_163920 [Auricularia subglabra TFB-10046 SS5]|nr:hypothetical protein AURDEDRAFT_163920 [Auricularia subglabra TFB-10046 SS5]